MKTVLLLVLVFVASFSSTAQNTDLPGPTSNLQTLSNGSYVIAMDNTLQTNSAGDFNLKTYGLVVHLLNNNVKVKWAIKSGKSKDGIDFTATAEQFQPNLIAGGVSRNFKAGPFFVDAADTTGVAALITAYYTAGSLTGNNRPRVYRLTAAASNVDVRYDLSGFKPKANIMNDGGNQNIHVGYMTNCGITTANYRVGPATDLYTKCYTFASEPHNDHEDHPAIAAIKSFVQYGGNFLAQCAAIETYENSVSGHFHTTNGINVVNSGISTASTIYPNADLAFSQYEGAFDIHYGGSVNNWTLAAGSSFINNEHNHATGGTMATQTPIGASVAKLTAGTMPGGLVFYLGSHNFSSVTAIESINGIRMYMNAFLTPVAINSNCTVGVTIPNPLPVKLVSFNANLDPNQSKVNLTWTTGTEINTSRFVIERSADGKIFSEAATIFAFGNTMELKNYRYSDKITSLEAKAIYYRLRQVDMDDKAEYSDIRVVRIGQHDKNSISINTYPNPAGNELSITIPTEWQNKNLTCELINANGLLYKRIETRSSKQTEIINLATLSHGFYIIKVSCNGKIAEQKIIKQ